MREDKVKVHGTRPGGLARETLDCHTWSERQDVSLVWWLTSSLSSTLLGSHRNMDIMLLVTPLPSYYWSLLKSVAKQYLFWKWSAAFDRILDFPYHSWGNLLRHVFFIQTFYFGSACINDGYSYLEMWNKYVDIWNRV